MIKNKKLVLENAGNLSPTVHFCIKKKKNPKLSKIHYSTARERGSEAAWKGEQFEITVCSFISLFEIGFLKWNSLQQFQKRQMTPNHLVTKEFLLIVYSLGNSSGTWL